MNKIFNKKLWSYVGRFSLIHVITYSSIAVAFLIFQESIPSSDRVALDFFKPFSSLGLVVIFKQIIAGCILALILYPFYNTVVKGDNCRLILFGVLWGLVLLGSVEPMPGSIEGLIYTKTTLAEHSVVLVAKAFQVYLFSSLFLSWEWSYQRRINISKGGINHE